MGYEKENIIKENYSQNRFNYQYSIGDNIIVRLCGPELKSGYKSCSIELKGDGCREFENICKDKNWIDFLTFFLIRLNASPTRIDLTIDDYEGKDVTFEYINKKLENNFYISSFQDRDFIYHGSKTKGLSIQFGTHSSTQMFVIYEKLKEQLTKGIPCLQKYWVRYEMRFKKEKAYNVCMNLISKEIVGFKDYVLGLLYQTLDIKEDNNYNNENQKRAMTDKNWNNFLESVSKAKIEKYKIRKSTYETYLKWSKQHIAFYILNKLLHQGINIEATYTELLKEVVQLIQTIDQNRIKKLNNFLKESGLGTVTILDLEELKIKLTKIIEDRELPF